MSGNFKQDKVMGKKIHLQLEIMKVHGGKKMMSSHQERKLFASRAAAEAGPEEETHGRLPASLMAAEEDDDYMGDLERFIRKEELLPSKTASQVRFTCLYSASCVLHILFRSRVLSTSFL